LGNRRVLALVVNLVTGRDLKQIRVGLTSGQICNCEGLFAEKWTAAHGEQIEAELLGVPILRQAGEGLIVAQHAGVRDGGFADADCVEAEDTSGS
jgi:hypothetical protein